MLQTGSSVTEQYEDAHLAMDFARKFAALDGRQMPLTRKEFELLSLLVRNAGEVVRRDALLREVWGYSPEIRTRTLDVHVRRLRKKLGAYSDRYIETIFGMGYRFQPYRNPRPVEAPRIERPFLAISA